MYIWIMLVTYELLIKISDSVWGDIYYSNSAQADISLSGYLGIASKEETVLYNTVDYQTTVNILGIQRYNYKNG